MKLLDNNWNVKIKMDDFSDPKSIFPLKFLYGLLSHFPIFSLFPTTFFFWVLNFPYIENYATAFSILKDFPAAADVKIQYSCILLSEILCFSFIFFALFSSRKINNETGQTNKIRIQNSWDEISSPTFLMRKAISSRSYIRLAKKPRKCRCDISNIIHIYEKRRQKIEEMFTQPLTTPLFALDSFQICRVKKIEIKNQP